MVSMTYVDSDQSYALVGIDEAKASGMFWTTSLNSREKRALLFPEIGKWITLLVEAQIAVRPRPVSVPAGTWFRLAEKGNPSSFSNWEILDS